MTLYHKDGSVYKLIAPNPAMKEQNIWSAFSVHNMTWKPEFKEDGTIVMPMGSDFELSEKNHLIKAESSMSMSIPKIKTN